MARFFCDNCQTEVKRDSGRCPHCGRIFAFVRCPQCSFTGEEGLFKKGCPVCGYCTPEDKPGGGPAGAPGKGPLVPAGKLPPWVYAAAFLALAAVTAVLVLALR